MTCLDILKYFVDILVVLFDSVTAECVNALLCGGGGAGLEFVVRPERRVTVQSH